MITAALAGVRRRIRRVFTRSPSPIVRSLLSVALADGPGNADDATPLDPGRKREDSPRPSRLLIASTRAGFEASVLMDLPMSAQSDGFAPAFVAAGVLRNHPPETVARRDAALAHHGAGALGGVLFALSYSMLERVLGDRSRIDGLSVPAYPLAVGFVTAFVYVFFARFVLPVFGGTVRERSHGTRRAWLLSTLAYGLALAALVPLRLELEASSSG